MFTASMAAPYASPGACSSLQSAEKMAATAACASAPPFCTAGRILAPAASGSEQMREARLLTWSAGGVAPPLASVQGGVAAGGGGRGRPGARRRGRAAVWSTGAAAQLSPGWRGQPSHRCLCIPPRHPTPTPHHDTPPRHPTSTPHLDTPLTVLSGFVGEVPGGSVGVPLLAGHDPRAIGDRCGDDVRGGLAASLAAAGRRGVARGGVGAGAAAQAGDEGRQQLAVVRPGMVLLRRVGARAGPALATWHMARPSLPVHPPPVRLDRAPPRRPASGCAALLPCMHLH